MSTFVGMLDWGIGGIACYRLLKAAHPNAPVLYWSDTGATPYGKLTTGALRTRVQAVVDELLSLGATQIVLACNAASTVLPSLRIDVPCTGVIDHVQGALPCGFRGHVGIIGGARTIRSGQHRRALSALGLTVEARIAQPLSAHIEGGTIDSEAYRRDVARIMRPLVQMDGLLLACTHYAAVSVDLLSFAKQAQLFDPVPALVDYVGRTWTLPETNAPDRFVTTGDPKAMQEAAARVWGVTLPACERVTLKR